MKILYVGRSCQIGGVPNVRLRAAHGLMPLGHEIHLLSQGGPMAAEFKKAGVHFHLTGPTPFNRLHLAFLLKRGRFDVIHADNPAAGEDVLAALRWAKMSEADRPAFIIAVHGIFDAKITASPSLPLCDRVLVFDTSTITRLKQLEGMAGQVFEMVRRPVEARDVPVAPGDVPHFVFVSRLSKTKAIAAKATIAAVDELAQMGWPEIRLTIVGDGSKRKELQGLADEVNARRGREVVSVVGAIKDPFPLMASATGVIGTAMVAMEALFHDIPVVAAGYQGYGTIGPDNLTEATECNFGDAVLEPRVATKELVLEGLRHILVERDSPQEKSDRKEVGERIRAQHSEEVVARGLERIYRDAIKAHSGLKASAG
jgi:glycosyltransferase involved in cell wall biosynthesis